MKRSLHCFSLKQEQLKHLTVPTAHEAQSGAVSQSIFQPVLETLALLGPEQMAGRTKQRVETDWQRIPMVAITHDPSSSSWEYFYPSTFNKTEGLEACSLQRGQFIEHFTSSGKVLKCYVDHYFHQQGLALLDQNFLMILLQVCAPAGTQMFLQPIKEGISSGYYFTLIQEGTIEYRFYTAYEKTRLEKVAEDDSEPNLQKLSTYLEFTGTLTATENGVCHRITGLRLMMHDKVEQQKVERFFQAQPAVWENIWHMLFGRSQRSQLSQLFHYETVEPSAEMLDFEKHHEDDKLQHRYPHCSESELVDAVLGTELFESPSSPTHFGSNTVVNEQPTVDSKSSFLGKR